VRLFEAAFGRIEALERQLSDRSSGRVKGEPATAPKALGLSATIRAGLSPQN
jgi:hypothetical protein